MRALVAGQHGYIGSVLAPRIAYAGHDATGGDTFFDEGRDPVPGPCPVTSARQQAAHQLRGIPSAVMTIKASPWGWAALGATVVSAVGYATQTALDYVSKPDIVGQLVFYGLFGGFAFAALMTGVVAVVTGRHRRDHTLRLGLVAIGYVALAQTIQSLWD